jgi:nitrite reductase (NADH) large subunit
VTEPARKVYLIIGNSAAGLAAAQAIRHLDHTSTITVLSEESTWAYSRVSLSWLIKGSISQRSLFFRQADYYERLGIDLEKGQRVLHISPTDHTVHTAAGRVYSYHRLLIATGSSANQLEIPGSRLEGVNVLRHMRDAEAICARVELSRNALVIGGGLVGVKNAGALAHRGLNVRMAVSSGRVLSQMLNAEGSQIAAERLRSNGIDVACNTDVVAFDGDAEQVKSARLSDGSSVPCEVVIVAKGVTPNMGILAGTAGATNLGIVVDRHQRTSIPDVYSAGDVAESIESMTGLPDICPNWPTAVRQGHVAGTNMAGGDQEYAGNLRTNVVEIGGISFASVGDVTGGNGVELHYRGPDKHGQGCWLYVRDQHLTGAVLTGNIAGLHCLEWFIRRQQPVQELVNTLLTQPQHYVLHV